MPEFVATMTLGGEHSIMLSHLPQGIDLHSLSEKYFPAAKLDETSIGKFGLFGSDIDYNTYFPEVTPQEFNPEQDEFIEPVFRLLSNCIVSKNYMPTEFPAEVLKNSMPLLVGQTVNCDHETNIGNAIGSIKEVFWQESYKTGNKVIPGGINGVLRIDGKANPRIARGINMDPPSIHSNSVTVQFEWKPSHQFKDPYEFWDKLGTYDDKGEMVRRIATRIISYKETSLVSHGADPYAQKLDNQGHIINPGYADSVYNSFSEVIKQKMSRMNGGSYDFKGTEDNSVMYNTEHSITEGNHNNPIIKSSMNKELQEFLDRIFGENMLVAGEGQTASTELAFSEIQRLIQENTDLKSSKATSDQTIQGLQEEVKTLKESASKNEPFVKMGQDHFKEVKEATLSSYKKVAGEGKEDANIVALIENVDSLTTLISLKSTYDQQLEEKFPFHCADCGSHNVNRASSVTSQENGEKKDTNVKSTVDALEALANKKR